jgi:hypothetical protein
LGLGTLHRKNKEMEAPTYRKKDRENMDSINTTSPRHGKIRTPKRQRKIPRSGVTSIRSHGITFFISPQRSHWWLK